jgi:hypothetical protein
MKRVLEGLHIGEEFVQRVLLRIKNKKLGQFLVDGLHLLAHSLKDVALFARFFSEILFGKNKLRKNNYSGRKGPRCYF